MTPEEKPFDTSRIPVFYQNGSVKVGDKWFPSVERYKRGVPTTKRSTPTTMTDVDMSDIAAARRERDEMRERAEIAEEALSSLAGEMIYEGNSVSYIYDKMKVYKERVSELAAERDELERLADAVMKAGEQLAPYAINPGTGEPLTSKAEDYLKAFSEACRDYQRKGE